MNHYRSFIVSLIIISMLFILSCREKPDFNMAETINKWVAMWNNYDLSKVDELFLNDSSVTYFSSEKEGVIKGIEAVREHHKNFGFVVGGKAQENQLWLEDLTESNYGPAVVVTGIWFFQRASEPPENVQQGPVTIVYVYRNNEFRIAHMNFGNY